MNDVHTLEQKRHSLAHLLAAAVLQHYPSAKLTLGPAIDNGFYYDIDFGGEKISTEDLPAIEATMRSLLPAWQQFSHTEVSAEQAKETFPDNPYKHEMIDEIASKGETITLYTSGGFTDLCRGGHVDNMARDIASDSFVLDRVAGAYWRGDEKNTMLTRIYGLAFDTRKELDEFLALRESAKERDHRKLGRELDLFTFSELIGGGLPLFTPRGTLIRNAVIQRIQKLQEQYGYESVTTPHITRPPLFEASGHWEKFKDGLFHVESAHGGKFVMKPMNCPFHTQIYASQSRSYRDLPIRYQEIGVVYRDEQAGELMGLSRVRSISQDDGHVFCSFDQAEEEVGIIVTIIQKFYTDLGMLDEHSWVQLSVRDPQSPDKYLGTDENWQRAEEILESVAKKHALNYVRTEGEAAFYGPKLDFMFRDALGREQQLATAQLDLNMPERFGLEYTDDTGHRQTPVMIHRAISGSLERFMAVMIEHFGGWFPLWLAPTQIVLVPVNPDVHGEYTETVREKLSQANFRVDVSSSSGTLGKRIHSAKSFKIPYIIVIGDNEQTSGLLIAEGKDEKLSPQTAENLIQTLLSQLPE